jgi:hypothetical protein
LAEPSHELKPDDNVVAAVKQDAVDDELEKDPGLIRRSKDANLCVSLWIKSYSPI